MRMHEAAGSRRNIIGPIHIVETDDPSGRKDSFSSDNSSVYKRGQIDGSSVKTNYRKDVLFLLIFRPLIFHKNSKLYKKRSKR